jgi:hypothetical protein
MSIPFQTEQFEKKPNRAMPVVRVRVDKLVPTQTNWDQSKVDDIASKDPSQIDTKPLVHPFRGRYYVSDGHHRVAAAIQRGDTHMWVKRAK